MSEAFNPQKNPEASSTRPLLERSCDEISTYAIRATTDKLAIAPSMGADSSEHDKKNEYEAKIDILRETDYTSVEAFCSTDLSGLTKRARKSIIEKPDNWHPERREKHIEIVTDAILEAQALSDRLQEINPEPTIYIERGNTASGKTRALHSAQMEFFDNTTGNIIDTTGAMNPDVYKFKLRNGDSSISAAQVHDEGAMIGRMLAYELASPELSVIVDRRNETPEDIRDALNNAIETGRKVRVLDVDVPLEMSLVGVLMRPRGGIDPNVPFDAIAKGYVGIRANRKSLLDDVQRHSRKVVDNYVLTSFSPAERKSVIVAMLGDNQIRVVEGREDLFYAVSSEMDPRRVQADVEASGNIIINDAFIDYYCSTYLDDSIASQDYASKLAYRLKDFRGRTLRRSVDLMANMESPREATVYLESANRNLTTTSRTASGKVDISASATKADSMESIDSRQAASKAKENFNQAITMAFEQRNMEFTSSEDLRRLVEAIATQVNNGIVKEGKLIRSGDDSLKYPYTRIVDLPVAMEQFYGKLHKMLSDPHSDPVEIAAFCEFRIDLVDHFFADGCGKTAKAVSSFVLMRAGLPLPDYAGGRDEYYRHAPRTIEGLSPTADQEAWEEFLAYYKTMIKYG